MPGLKRASVYFARLSLSGWDGYGSVWVPNIAKAALDSDDRFIANQEYLAHRRILLVNPDAPIPEQYTVVRINESNTVYLVGHKRSNTSQNNNYLLVYTVHEANIVGRLMRMVKQLAASGTVKSVTATFMGDYHCSLERRGAEIAAQLPNVPYSDTIITVPNDCPVNSESEIRVGNDVYGINEIYSLMGLTQAFAIKRRTV